MPGIVFVNELCIGNIMGWICHIGDEAQAEELLNRGNLIRCMR